jgi:hypothetical protein
LPYRNIGFFKQLGRAGERTSVLLVNAGTLTTKA